MSEEFHRTFKEGHSWPECEPSQVGLSQSECEASQGDLSQSEFEIVQLSQKKKNKKEKKPQPSSSKQLTPSMVQADTDTAIPKRKLLSDDEVEKIAKQKFFLLLEQQQSIWNDSVQNRIKKASPFSFWSIPAVKYLSSFSISLDQMLLFLNRIIVYIVQTAILLFVLSYFERTLQAFSTDLFHLTNGVIDLCPLSGYQRFDYPFCDRVSPR